MERVIRGAKAISLLTRLKNKIDTNLKLPIRNSEMGLLILIVTNKEKISSVDAANFLNVSKPMIAKIVNSLQKKDYIYKEIMENDRHKMALIPTRKGKKLVEKAYDEYHKTMFLLQNKMGDEDYLKLVSMIEKANLILMEEIENE
ncbi:DNA-binding MarR family transcriptional regulator [Bacilli bacterium PM5-9]|nr:DNA-binding MarR family transcriptional regulator [Bacilli bacterium PM5-9]